MSISDKSLTKVEIEEQIIFRTQIVMREGVNYWNNILWNYNDWNTVYKFNYR